MKFPLEMHAFSLNFNLNMEHHHQYDAERLVQIGGTI